MSKLAKKPVVIPSGVTVAASGNTVSVSGTGGVLAFPILPHLNIVIENGTISVRTQAKDKQARANLGTMVSLIKNAIHGVTVGFSKSLSVEGIGFRASLAGTTLTLTVGFTHPVTFEPPKGVKIVVEKNVITVSGADKQLVGEAAAQIRRIKKPEPYKGKGIRYSNEVVRRKAGKKVAGATGAVK